MDIHHNQIDLAISIKTAQLKRCDLKSITEQHVKDTLFGFIWKYEKPKTLSKAIDDILKLTVGDIVGYLSSQAIIEGAMMNENDIERILEEYS